MNEIVKYLQNECKDIKQYACIGCGKITLYDKAGAAYVVRFRTMTMTDVQVLVAALRINDPEILKTFNPRPVVRNGVDGLPY